MNQPLIPIHLQNEILLHISKTVSQMQKLGVDALLVSTNVNIYYSTGRFFRGYVLISAEKPAQYFVIKPQIYSPSENVHYIRKPEQIPEILKTKGWNIEGKLGFEEDVMTYSDALRLMKVFQGVEIVNGSQLLRNARMTKTPYELEQMRLDGVHHMKAYSRISELYRPGMTDLELQIAIEQVLRKEGCLGYARVAGNLMEINLGSVLAGDNADNPSPYEFAMGGEGADASLPGGANGSLIKRGETVMVDMNGAFNAYQTDMTRIWTLGDIPEKAYRAHDCSRRILRVLERESTPGTEACALYFRAMEIAEEEGLKDFFMGHNQQASFIGHGVGIELNEQPPIAPRCKTVLEENMTIALEPKFVIPGVGAVGVENTYVVTPRGLENLTRFDEEIMKFQTH